MSSIERVKLTYSLLTIATVVIYSFVIPQIGKLWPTVYFIVAECIKLGIIQKLFYLDTSPVENNKKRSNKLKNILVESIKFAILILLTTASFAFICVVLGAPALHQFEETFALSSLLTTLSLFPISLFVGVNSTMLILFTESFVLVNVDSKAYLKDLKRNAFLVLFAAFGGSIVAPLDWDRPWYVCLSIL